MHRLVWGIVTIAFGLLFFASAGENPDGPAGSIVVGILCLAGGGTLIFFGARYLSRRKAVAQFALQMLRSDEKIDAGAIGIDLNLGEIEVRTHLFHYQRKGTIPFKAIIV